MEWKRLQKLAGIDPPFTFQTLRKTCASLYTEHFGRDVASYLAGHSVPGMTATWYTNPTRQIVHAVNNLPQPESFKTAKTFCVSRTNRHTDFVFQPGWVSYRGEMIHLPPGPLAVLQALVAAGRPLSFSELRRAAFWNKPQISDDSIEQYRSRPAHQTDESTSFVRRMEPGPVGPIWKRGLVPRLAGNELPRLTRCTELLPCRNPPI